MSQIQLVVFSFFFRKDDLAAEINNNCLPLPRIRVSRDQQICAEIAKRAHLYIAVTRVRTPCDIQKQQTR